MSAVSTQYEYNICFSFTLVQWLLLIVWLRGILDFILNLCFLCSIFASCTLWILHPFADFLGRTEVRMNEVLEEAKVKKGPITKRLILHEVDTGEVIVKLDLQLYESWCPSGGHRRGHRQTGPSVVCQDVLHVVTEEVIIKLDLQSHDVLAIVTEMVIFRLNLQWHAPWCTSSGHEFSYQSHREGFSSKSWWGLCDLDGSSVWLTIVPEVRVVMRMQELPSAWIRLMSREKGSHLALSHRCQTSKCNCAHQYLAHGSCLDQHVWMTQGFWQWVTASLDAVKGAVSRLQQCKRPSRRKTKRKNPLWTYCSSLSLRQSNLWTLAGHVQTEKKNNTNYVQLRSECSSAYHHEWQVYGDKTSN